MTASHPVRKRIGLALGGGVARGISHLGVLSVLLEAGIPIDCVAGTSAGSIAGAFFCAGRDIAEAVRIASRLSWWYIARPVWPREGFLSFARLERFIIRELGDISFSALKIPYAAVATDIDTGHEVVLCEGRLAPAVRASSSPPGFVTPTHLFGRRLVDGSISNTIPVSAARAMGADYVIGVDIFPFAVRRFLGALGLGFTAIEILIENAGGGHRDADCLICPDLSGKSYVRFSSSKLYYELGRKAALEKMPQIQKDISF